MPNPLTVVISQGQSRNPVKRSLEQSVADAVVELDQVSVAVIPHLYDLAAGGESLRSLQEIRGDMVILSWVYERAAHWILDRGGVRGQIGLIELVRDESDDESDESSEDKPRVIDESPRPDRFIYCLDFRVSESANDFLKEISRIASLPRSDDSYIDASHAVAAPAESTLSLAGLSNPTATEPASASPSLFGIGAITKIDESPSRRWYPVIDFSRCTNCMECIDFCLFGVYGVDTIETILVDQPDNCRKGCPACSRVCPENAIIFPQHKSPAIAGAPVEAGGLKIDLSKLFGAPDSDEDAVEVAARERDEQLLLAGRAAVGLSVGIPKRQENKDAGPKDDLDNLLDELDDLDL